MKQRIDWIDTAKGIAILMVVLQHTTGIDHTHIGMINAHISLPLFFLVSGYFFKNNQTLSDFLKSKAHSLLIPALFFFWLGCVLFYAMQALGVQMAIPFEWRRCLDIFTNTENMYCNGVVWFLIALFWINVICYCFRKLSIKHLVALSLIVSVLSAGGGICRHISTQLCRASYSL